MIGPRTFGRHADLVQRMAETVGADLPRAIARGALSPGDLRGAVLSCSRCSAPDACGDWLDRADAGARTAPSYCRNAVLLARLAAETPPRPAQPVAGAAGPQKPV